MVLDDATLLQSIASLQSEDELRQVLNYLVLLQPESVERALTYVKAQNKGKQQNGSAMSVRSARSITSRGHMDTDDASVAPPSTSRNKSSKKHKLQLVILCSNAPSVTQALNQDYAMKLCKQQHIAPFIVLLEDPLQHGLVQQLLQLAQSSSSTSEVPLLFTRPRTPSHHKPALQGFDYTFVGDFSRLEELERKGEFTAQSLLMNATTTSTTTSTSTTSSTVPDHLVGAHQPRRKLSSDNVSLDIDKDLFEDKSQDERPTHKPLTQAALKAKAAAATMQPRNSNGAVHNRTNSPQQTNRKAQASSSPDAFQAVPDFLVPLNQPTTVHSDDDLSIDSLKELFDPPRPSLQPGQRPLVEAAKKAAAAMQASNQGTSMEAQPSSTTKRAFYGGVVLSPSKPRRPEVDSTIHTSVEVVELKPPAASTTRNGSPKHSPSHKHTKTPPTIVDTPAPHDLVYQHPHVQDDTKHHIPTVVPEHATSTTVNTPAVQDLVYQQHATHAAATSTSTTPIVEHATSDSVNTPAVNDMEYQHPSTVDQTVVPEPIVEEPEEEEEPAVVEQASAPPPAVAKPEPEPVVPPAPAPAPPAAVKQVATVAPAPVPEPVAPVEPKPALSKPSQATTTSQTKPACYLVLSDDANELNIYFSELPMENAVGIWSSPDIVAFQQAQNLGSQAWIGQACSGILENSLHYYTGWTQFIKAAKSMDQASVTITGSGYPVDVYTYYNGTSTYVEKGDSIHADELDAVACLPPNNGFDFRNVKGKKWSKAAKKLGAVAVFKSLKEPQPPQQNVNASFDTMTSDEGDTLRQEEEQVKAVPAPAPAAAAVPAAPPAVLAPPKIAAATEPQAQVQAQPVAPASTSTSSSTMILASPLDAPPGPACYLIYEPDSSGRLVLHYSKTPLEHAIGMWTPGAGKQISGFKFKQNLGRSVLIGSCSSGVQGRKNYCSGWCQFVRAARLQAGQVTIWDPTSKGLPVDIWLYNDTNKTNLDQSHKLVLGEATDVSTILAVACLPKNTDFYANLTVDLHKWMADGNSLGAVSKF